MSLKALWAQDRYGIIGVNGRLPWHIPEDLEHFKNLTVGDTVIMGRKTWESLPHAPLKNRENVIFTTRSEGEWSKGAIATRHIPLDGWLIGGEETFRALLPFCEELYVTTVDVCPDNVRHAQDIYGGTHFTFAPSIGEEQWNLSHHQPWQESTTGLRFRYSHYIRKNSIFR